MDADRRMLLGLVAAVAIAAATAGWLAGQRIKSPAEVAAATSPPEPSLIAVPIELRTLSQNVVIRGTVTPKGETSLVALSTTGSGVVTRLPKGPGDSIQEGDVLAEIAGRPVIALRGRLPAFRNLIPGLQGPEVSQLEAALVRLGYSPGAVDDTFTADTAAAVELLYQDRGYAAPEPDPGDVANLDIAQSAVAAAEDALDAAQGALETVSAPVPATERRRLDLAVAQAELDLAIARSAADAANAEAESAVADAEAALVAANASGPSGGVDPDARSEAEAALTLAQDAATLVATEQQLALEAAELSLAEAIDARAERLDPPDLSDLQAAVADAERDLRQTRADLTATRATVGVWVPQTEVVFFPSLPREVAQVFADVGEDPAGPVMTIAGAGTVIESAISTADRQLIAVGDEAMLEDDRLGIAVPARIAFIAESPGGPELSSDRYAVDLEPTGVVPDAAIGLNLRVTIPITSSGGDVLAVPLAALSSGADGTTRLELERAPGQTEFVDVVAGLRAEGLVEVTSLGARLAEGDRVVVGRDLVLPGIDAINEDDP